MKKRIALFVLLISLFSIVAEAAFSGKYLCVRKNYASGSIPWTFKKRLYTVASEAGSNRLAVRVNGSTLYAVLQNFYIPEEAFRVHKGSTMLVVREDFANAAPTVFSTGITPSAIAVGASEIYVSNGSTVTRFPKSGGSSLGSFTLPGGSILSGMAFNPSDGNLYLTDSGRDIVEVRTPTGAFVRTIAYVTNPDGIDFDAAGDVVFACSGSVQTKTIAGGNVRSFSISGGYYDLKVDRANGTIVLAVGSAIVGYSPGGSVRFNYSANFGVYAVAVTPSGNIITAQSNPAHSPGNKTRWLKGYVKANQASIGELKEGSSLGNDSNVYGIAYDPQGFIYFGNIAGSSIVAYY